MAESQGKATGNREGSSSGSSELVTESGKTTIHEIVVAKITARAAREIPGVSSLTAEGVSGFAERMTEQVTGNEQTSGVNVDVGEREAAVDLGIVVDYEVSIPQLTEAVRNNIMRRVNSMTGLVVREVNIDVIDLAFPGEEPSRQSRVE